MQMDAGLDTGPVLLEEATAISERETAGTLHQRLARLGGQCIVRALEQIDAGCARPVPQPTEGVTYAAKLEKDEARIDWARTAVEVDRQVRAFNPFPGAFTRNGGETIKVWAARPVAGAGSAPGTVEEAGAQRIVVACGTGALALEELQRAGGRRLPVRDFQRGAGLERGQRLGGEA